MRITVDERNCCGHARCWAMAKEFYKLDSNGYNALRGQTVEVPRDMEKAARLGAKACPDRVITIIEE